MSEDINREYYGQLAAGREAYWRKMAAPRFRVTTLLRLLKERPQGSLVDLGCGNGQLLREIRARHQKLDLCGIDLSPAQVAKNQRDFEPEVRFHAVDLDQPQASAFPFDLRRRFDTVVAMEVIEHLRAPRTFLENARALVHPGGRLLLSTQSGPLRETERRVGHLRHYSAAEMRALLQEAGWRPQRVWNSGFPFHDLSKWYANLRPDATMRRFGEQAYGLREELICAVLRALFLANSTRTGAQLFAVATPGEEGASHEAPVP